MNYNEHHGVLTTNQSHTATKEQGTLILPGLFHVTHLDRKLHMFIHLIVCSSTEPLTIVVVGHCVDRIILEIMRIIQRTTRATTMIKGSNKSTNSRASQLSGRWKKNGCDAARKRLGGRREQMHTRCHT